MPVARHQARRGSVKPLATFLHGRLFCLANSDWNEHMQAGHWALVAVRADRCGADHVLCEYIMDTQ